MKKILVTIAILSFFAGVVLLPQCIGLMYQQGASMSHAQSSFLKSETEEVTYLGEEIKKFAVVQNEKAKLSEATDGALPAPNVAGKKDVDYFLLYQESGLLKPEVASYVKQATSLDKLGPTDLVALLKDGKLTIPKEGEVLAEDVEVAEVIPMGTAAVVSLPTEVDLGTLLGASLSKDGNTGTTVNINDIGGN